MKARGVGPADIGRIEAAIGALRAAREDLVAAGAGRSAERVRRAIKSSEGALRHVRGIATRMEARR